MSNDAEESVKRKEIKIKTLLTFRNIYFIKYKYSKNFIQSKNKIVIHKIKKILRSIKRFSIK